MTLLTLEKGCSTCVFLICVNRFLNISGYGLESMKVLLIIYNKQFII